MLRRHLALLCFRPSLFFRKAAARLAGHLPGFSGSVSGSIGQVRFEFDFRLDPLVRQMYFGAYEPEVVACIRRLLRPGGVAVDVGASIGYMAAVMASAVGKEGAVHCFEPVPGSFEALEKFRRVNPDYSIMTNCTAVGIEEGRARIWAGGMNNIGWNSMVPGEYAGRFERTLEVPVARLDRYLLARGMDRVSLVKIDVEGYEARVLAGMEEYFSRTPDRPRILCEIWPEACLRLGIPVGKLFADLGRFGYRPFSLDTPPRELSSDAVRETSNVLFASE